MPAARLLQRVRERLDERGAPAAAESVELACDIVRLALRALGSVQGRAGELDPLVRAVSVRTGLPRAVVELVVDTAQAPELRSGSDAHALRAFGGRFGEDVAAALRAEDAEDVDLEAFGRRHGPSEALLLLDVLFACASTDGQVEPREVGRLQEAARQLGVDEVLVTALLQKHDPRHARGERGVPLRGERLLIGRSTGADVVLADPQVAPRHAELVRVGDGWRVVDLASGRPTVVNGVAVGSAPLGADTVLRIGPYTLRRVDDEIRVFGERTFSALSVRGLTRRIGGTLLLDDVRFTVFTGEVVALVGPSGSGKTTLLSAINGLAPADDGEVLFDGRSFHDLLAADRSVVGSVPQDDLVLPELSVEESLWSSGRLRFPRDVRDAEVDREVERVLDELDIRHIRKSRIGDAVRRGISGGQRKRVNLGQELMSRSTRVLFLDEPTSGLDPRASQDIVRLVRQLADAGRIVFLVTHDLSPEIIALVDHLLVMAPGGRLAFFGPPEEACRHFGVATADGVFSRFGERPPAEWAERYRASEAWRRYVITREHLLGLEGVARRPAGASVPPRRSALLQLRTLVARTARVKARDRTGLFVLAAQPPILAAVMQVVFPAPTAPMLFMLSLSCMWFGMSAAVRELIADRVVWHREHRIGVGVGAYVGAKVLVLGGIVAVQAAFLATAAYFGVGMAEYGFAWAALAGVSVLVAFLGLSVGLFTSAIWGSSEAAVGTLPLLLIPQITFSGIMVSLRDMGPLAKGVTWVTFQRYAFDAILKTGDEVANSTYTKGEFEAQAVGGTLWKLGLRETASVEDVGLSLPVLAGVMGGASALLLAATLWRVARRAKRLD